MHIYSDPDHFTHIYEHLFVPAVTKAGFVAIPPKAAGAAIIHVEIIRHLRTADLVLCDMSSLNANVFFELGIRTALDGAVCLVRDQHLVNMPFDTHLLNCHEYDAALSMWKAAEEIEALYKYVAQTFEHQPQGNALWRLFGTS